MPEVGAQAVTPLNGVPAGAAKPSAKQKGGAKGRGRGRSGRGRGAKVERLSPRSFHRSVMAPNPHVKHPTNKKFLLGKECRFDASAVQG